jgi:hypothetical protein
VRANLFLLIAAACAIGCAPRIAGGPADAAGVRPIDRVDLFVRNAAREFVELSATRRVRGGSVTWSVQRYDGRLRPIGRAEEHTDMVVRMLESFDMWALNAPDAPGAACRTVKGRRNCAITFNDYSLVMKVERGREIRVQRYTGLERSTANQTARALADFVFAWARQHGGTRR